MLNINLAKELKKAGLSWSPEVGDWFATKLSPIWWLNGKKTGEEGLYFLTGKPTDAGYYGWSMVDSEPFCELVTHDGQRQEESWKHLGDNFTWLPRLDQLLQELVKHTKSFKLVYEKYDTDSKIVAGYWVTYTIHCSEDEEAPPSEVICEKTTEEAVGKALLSLMERTATLSHKKGENY